MKLLDLVKGMRGRDERDERDQRDERTMRDYTCILSLVIFLNLNF